MCPWLANADNTVASRNALTVKSWVYRNLMDLRDRLDHQQRDSQHLTFGVSGLLHDSDLLMYDHQTESLWSQIEGRAIAGPLAGTELSASITTPRCLRQSCGMNQESYCRAR